MVCCVTMHALTGRTGMCTERGSGECRNTYENRRDTCQGCKNEREGESERKRERERERERERDGEREGKRERKRERSIWSSCDQIVGLRVSSGAVLFSILQ